jgi:hypothetical protein
MRGILALGAGAAAAVAIALSTGIAVGSNGASRDDDHLAEVRDATARYRNVDRAVDAGYVQFFGCVHEPLAGSMGIHFVNGALAGDTVVDAAAPEALMYEVRPNGQLSLVGVEYVVFQEAWDAEHDAPPELFGHSFHLVEEPNRYGIPSFYALHAWAWKDNPTGAHEDWNPTALCLNPDI